MCRYAVIFSILLMGFAAACNSDAKYVLVTVSDLPPETAFLSERAARDVGAPSGAQLASPAELAFDLRSTPPSVPGTFSFVLSPQPWASVGAWLRFIVAVAAFDAAGCLVGVGRKDLFPPLLSASGDVATVALNVKLRRFSRPDCTGTRALVLHEVTPSGDDLCFAQAAGEPPCLCVIGWGFDPNSRLVWNGLVLQPFLKTRWVSAASMTICNVSPPFAGPLRITNPDGQTAALDNVAF